MLRPLNPEALKPGRYPALDAASPEVHFFNLHGEHVAYDANSMAALHLDRETWTAAQNDSAALAGLLGSRAMPQLPLVAPGAIRKLVLNVTHACNLRCGYCFAAKYAEAATMTANTARRAVRAAFPPPRAEHERRHRIDISFFGGEPLLAWATLAAAVDAAERLAAAQQREAAFHVTTNAVALDAAMAAYLAEHRFSVLVSCDGPAALHNAARPARGEVDSFERTCNGLRLLKEAGVRTVTIRGTFPLEEPRLIERMECYAAWMREGLCGGFSLEPAMMTEGCARRGGDLDDALVTALRREYHAAAEWYMARLRAGEEPGFFHFRKLLQRLESARPQASECGAGVGYVTVGPTGDVFACHRETGTRIGTLAQGIDEHLRAAWCDNRIYRRRGCMECWARWVCGGGCRQHAAEAGGPLSEPNRAACVVMRIMASECLWILTQQPARAERGRSDG